MQNFEGVRLLVDDVPKKKHVRLHLHGHAPAPCRFLYGMTPHLFYVYTYKIHGQAGWPYYAHIDHPHRSKENHCFTFCCCGFVNALLGDGNGIVGSIRTLSRGQRVMVDSI